jgi:hypothetical protein
VTKAAASTAGERGTFRSCRAPIAISNKLRTPGYYIHTHSTVRMIKSLAHFVYPIRQEPSSPKSLSELEDVVYSGPRSEEVSSAKQRQVLFDFGQNFISLLKKPALQLLGDPRSI